MIKLIWAEAHNHVIADKGDIPWKLPADQQFFKQLTLNHPIVFGRNTLLSFRGRPLPKRTNIVLSHDTKLEVPAGFTLMHSIEEVMAFAKAQNDDLYVIGGKGIYQSFMPYADELIVTEIDADISGDTQMDAIDLDTWQVVNRVVGTVDEKNIYPHIFKTYQRK
ncbi:dihydrofolate reductase [Periweissella cryptocerci]|uniref:Dihydrofolate reductase n=1 Tax=Periweissella cryptocerci TaxID=2506420 RepID=A0A4P6YWK4_9LACO|nr:dihydrofolate reductase [Periweissella cryptocerci]QBO37163.1 dihydrofolate reductase [Periweissella cryptocerci]